MSCQSGVILIISLIFLAVLGLLGLEAMQLALRQVKLANSFSVESLATVNPTPWATALWGRYAKGEIPDCTSAVPLVDSQLHQRQWWSNKSLCRSRFGEVSIQFIIALLPGAELADAAEISFQARWHDEVAVYQAYCLGASEHCSAVRVVD